MAIESGQDNAPETPAEPMPGSEQTQEVQPEANVAPSEGTEASQEGTELPEGSSDRTTEQFDKLKTHNAQLREQLSEYESYIQNLAKQPQVQKSEEDRPLYDQSTGIVDVEQLENLKKVAASADKRAKSATEKLEKYVQEVQEREAYTAYPELDKKNKDFDDVLYKTTRAILTDSMINPRDYGGKELTMVEAAKLASSVRDKKVETAKKEAAKEAVESLTPKEQAALQASGTAGRRSEGANYDNLVQRTREGDLSAIVERLKHIPSV